MSEYVRRARTHTLPPSVVGGSPLPTCSACHESGRLWQLDARRFRICRPCLKALMALAADIEAMRHRVTP